MRQTINADETTGVTKRLVSIYYYAEITSSYVYLVELIKRKEKRKVTVW